MAMFLFFLFLAYVFFFHTNAQMPGFVSIDCGGVDQFTDDLGIEWVPDIQFYGQRAKLSIPSENRKQYTTLRYFPADDWKYCYTFNVTSRSRYLVRATFLYGNFDSSNVYPKFDISLGATHWSTIVISDATTMEVRELILLASSPTISVCLSNATTGQPFISTLELRQFNGSIYYTDFETKFFLSVSARINFGSVSDDPVRYPDDPFDRIWESDSLKKANYLVDVAPGTEKISTVLPIDVNRDERPPEKVMQTAVVGRNGTLTYRLNLDGFPGSGWAFCYFAEIEELSAKDSRKFRLHLPGMPEVSKASVDIEENAQGRYRLYEPGFTNLSLPFVLSFSFMKASDSSMGPLLNAMEINKYLEINYGSQDATLIASLTSRFSLEAWAQEGGDPCLPVPLSWVQCNLDPQPRIVSIWLNGNLLAGPIPDFTGCPNLKKIHLENNQLTGPIPSSLVNLESLSELYLQNNSLSGTVPRGLLSKNLLSNFSGNKNLHYGKSEGNHIKIIIGSTVGAAILLLAVMASLLFMCRRKKRASEEELTALPSQKLVSFLTDAATETAHSFTLSEIEDVTAKFGKRIGSGGYGVVYYGKMKDGKEIAVKVLTSDTYQGKREFSNEVSLLSRIHHRNLVQFLGYCQEEGRNILVYEFMHNGTLKEHLYGPLIQDRAMDWIKRLEIAEDAAKGIEYLHTGCVPPIIHRDLKTSNILLDKNMRAKVADFGLSKLSVEGSTHVTSIVRGTVGYLDPEYYVSQHLTDRSDVYSFGVILLELVTGREALSNESFGPNCRNIVQWAKSQVENGNVRGIIDPSLGGGFKLQSMWKITEKALLCVQPNGRLRPPISEVLKEIQEALLIERRSELGEEGDSGTIESAHSASHAGSQDLGVFEPYISYEDPVAIPTAR
ncbi:probable LRR receptor-like serine/threonine-protein kinase At1g67720 isoform X2 [Magnolia sinica]|uniref:probable LRR receptor-like serine/threonine-protein kinase At1g67720 isoform X2 n=1 Tax=Magnolia sinica TaxID=86752 RepID=UPI00265B2164|nr:probable LRR receptor-like serine/threonine-protein kinase At1g67720 isoform X2 [Magnolia sinica]